MTRFAVSKRLARLIPIAHERAVRGAEIATTGQVHRLSPDTFFVIGTDTYIVDLQAGSCSCPDARAPYDDGVKYCKHMCAVLMSD